MSVISKTKQFLKSKRDFIRSEKEFSNRYKIDIIEYINFIMNKFFDENGTEDFEHKDLNKVEVEYDSEIISNLYRVDNLIMIYSVTPNGSDGSDAPIHEYSISVLSNLLITLLNIEEISSMINSKLFNNINELYQQGSDFRMNMMKGFNHFNKSQMGGSDILKARENTEINRMSSEVFDEDDSNDDSLYPSVVHHTTEPEYEINLDETDEDDSEVVPSDGTDGLNINVKDNTMCIRKSSRDGYGFNSNLNVQSNSNPIVKFSNFE